MVKADEIDKLAEKLKYMEDSANEKIEGLQKKIDTMLAENNTDTTVPGKYFTKNVAYTTANALEICMRCTEKQIEEVKK